MKRKLLFSVLTAMSFLLCSCSTNANQPNDELSIGRKSLCGNIVVSADSNLVIYTDLNENSSAPACVQAGCSHDRNSQNCTAFVEKGQILYPFIYNDSLYFFYIYDGIEFYKSDISGGNRVKAYTYYSEPSDPDEICGTPAIVSVKNKGSKLYISIVDTIMKKGEAAGVLSGKEYFSLIEMDLSTNSTKLIYNTETLYDGNLSILSVGDNSVFCNLSGQTMDYSTMDIDERLELLENPDSDYWDTYLTQTVKIDIASGETEVLPDTDGRLVVCGDGYYYTSSSDPNKLLNNSGEVVFSGEIMSFLPYKDKLILITSDNKTYIISENKNELLASNKYFMPIAINENNVLGYDNNNTLSYCKTGDYLSGSINFTPLNLYGGL